MKRFPFRNKQSVNCLNNLFYSFYCGLVNYFPACHVERTQEIFQGFLASLEMTEQTFKQARFSPLRFKSNI